MEPLLPARRPGSLLQSPARAHDPGRSFGRSFANGFVGTTAYGTGDVAGFGEAAGRLLPDTVDFLGSAFGFLDDLAKPDTPEGQAARSRLGQAFRDGAAVAAHVAAHPRVVGQVATRAARDLADHVMPDIRPSDPDTSAQFDRNFKAGMRAGDLQFQGALAAAPELKGLGAARSLTRAEQIMKSLKDFSLRDAKYLAEPYPWKGHHAVAKRARIPKDIFGVPLPVAIAGKALPKVFTESAFNLVKPKGITRGEMYELHARIDPHFHGTGGLPDSRRWSARDLGIQRYDPVRRVWYGTPDATKKAVAGVAGASAAGGGLAYQRRKGGGQR
jgi:hypothetical protein